MAANNDSLMTDIVAEFEELAEFMEKLNQEDYILSEIPSEMPKIVQGDWKSRKPSDSLKEGILREKYFSQFMYGFVSWRWVVPFSEWISSRKCLEVMAGRGWLSYALRQKGIDIIATDDLSWIADDASHIKPVTEIEQLDAVDSVRKYGKDVDIVIMSWPPMDETAYKVLKELSIINPNAKLVYIGERMSGMTASDSFFSHFRGIADPGFMAVQEKYQKWDGINDSIYLGHYESR